MDDVAINTDKKVWTKPSDDIKDVGYMPEILVTENNDITLLVGGTGITAPIEKWHALGDKYLCVSATDEQRIKDLKDALHSLEGVPVPFNLHDSVRDLTEWADHPEDH